MWTTEQCAVVHICVFLEGRGSADFGYADDALPYTDSISEVNYISKSDFKSIV